MKHFKTRLMWTAILFMNCLFITFAAEAGLLSEYRNYIYYHCADWGPNLENPEEEKIYFIKQIIFEEDQVRYGNVVYFCSMNPDGSDKKEIKKLWEDTSTYLDLNGNTSFMDICWQTKEAAIAFSAGGKECTGMWLMNLDGTEFKRIVEHTRREDFRFRVNHPSWFPDGRHLVYEEKWLHTGAIEYYIVKIGRQGKEKVYLTEKAKDGWSNRYPVVSPDGKKIAYSHSIWKSEKHLYTENKTSGLYLMDADGSNKRLLYTNYNKYAHYPEWSPDGSKIHVIRPFFTIVDAQTGIIIQEDRNFSTGKVHWSTKYGFIIDGRGSISIYKEGIVKDIVLAKIVNTQQKRNLSEEKYRWGGN